MDPPVKWILLCAAAIGAALLISSVKPSERDDEVLDRQADLLAQRLSTLHREIAVISSQLDQKEKEVAVADEDATLVTGKATSAPSLKDSPRKLNSHRNHRKKQPAYPNLEKVLDKMEPFRRERVSQSQKVSDETQEMAARHGERLEALADTRAAKRPFVPLKNIGVVLSAWGKEKYVKEALDVYDNIQAVSPGRTVAIWTQSVHKDFLTQAAKERVHLKPMFYEDVDIPPNLAKCQSSQAPPPMFMRKIAGVLYSPFDITVMMDNDVHICNDFAHFLPTPSRDFDVAAAVAPFAPYAGAADGMYRNSTLPNDPTTREEYKEYQERNTGMMVLRTHLPAVRKLLKMWLELYTLHTNDTERCELYHHEQPAYREALFVHRHEVVERLIPLHSVCRQGNQIQGCVLRDSCRTEGDCDMYHCKVRLRYGHKTREQIADVP